MSTAWDKIDLSTRLQPAPNFIYYPIRFFRGEYKRINYYRVDQAFGYLLRTVAASWYTFYDSRPITIATVEIPEIEFFVRRQSRQCDPIPLNLETSPGGDAGNFAIYPLQLAASVKSKKVLNYFFQYGDTIEFHITRAPNFLDLNSGLTYTAGLHLVLMGYDVPEPSDRTWRRG